MAALLHQLTAVANLVNEELPGDVVQNEVVEDEQNAAGIGLGLSCKVPWIFVWKQFRTTTAMCLAICMGWWSLRTDFSMNLLAYEFVEVMCCYVVLISGMFGFMAESYVEF